MRDMPSPSCARRRTPPPGGRAPRSGRVCALTGLSKRDQYERAQPLRALTDARAAAAVQPCAMIAVTELLEEADPVETWRLECLRVAGYPPYEAFLVSRHPEIDLHRAIDLLAAGCPTATALRILF